MSTPKTTKQAHKALQKIMEEQAIKAARSEYDISVCITAVEAARITFEGVEISGPVSDYVERVYNAISDLRDGYNDSDGEYTNGTAPIGDVLGAVYDLKRDIES